jgi:hypothetical protein
MNKIDANLIHELNQEYQLEITQVINLNSIHLLRTKDDKQYILKKAKSKKLTKIYDYLLAQKFAHFIHPLHNRHKTIITKIDDVDYYLIPYVYNIDYSMDKRLLDYVDLLHKLHKTTVIARKFNRALFLKTYRRQIKKLNKQFSLLDFYIVECETKIDKSIFDWTYLFKYHEIMFIKNTLLKIQDTIEDELEKMDIYNYCLIHNNCSIDHFIVTNEKNYLISFDASMISLKIYDYIKIFIEYSEADVDWLNILLSEDINTFEFNYFIFNVLYYVILNIDITYLANNDSFASINSLVYNLHVCQKALELNGKYHSLRPSH